LYMHGVTMVSTKIDMQKKWVREETGMRECRVLILYLKSILPPSTTDTEPTA